MTFRDHNDALRAHTSFRLFLAKHYNEIKAGWITDRYDRYGAGAASPSFVAFEHMIDDTVNADICWLSHEMMDLCQHAMADFDSTERFEFEDAFIPHGFMVLPEAFKSRDINDKIIAHRTILWRVVEHSVVILEDNPDGGVSYTFDLNRSSEGISTEPTLRISTVSHVDDPDEFTDLYQDRQEELKAMGIEWGIAHATTIPLRLVASLADTSGEGDPKSAWLTFWRVAQKLMSERIITTERQQAHRSARREAQRYGYDPAAPRVIELRRPTDRDTDPEGERLRDVNWTHRWINRGHWRQQWYPTLQTHKQIWISAYVKGPSNLPLIVRERVWVWDR